MALETSIRKIRRTVARWLVSDQGQHGELVGSVEKPTEFEALEELSREDQARTRTASV